MCVATKGYGEFVSVIVFGSQGIVPLRTPDAISPRQCPTKNGLIPPSSRSKVILDGSHSYAPSFRGFRLDTASPPAKMVDIIPMSLWDNTSTTTAMQVYKQDRFALFGVVKLRHIVGELLFRLPLA